MQYLVFKPFYMKFPSKTAAVAELKRKLAAREGSREYVVRFTVGDNSTELKLDGAALLGRKEGGDWRRGTSPCSETGRSGEALRIRISKTV